MLEIQKATLDVAGSARLDQIRASMAGEQLGGTADRDAVGGQQPAAQTNDPGVARLDELRASMNRDRNPGDASAAG
jgi:hypothetical protein